MLRRFFQDSPAWPWQWAGAQVALQVQGLAVNQLEVRMTGDYRQALQFNELSVWLGGYFKNTLDLFLGQ